MEQITSPPAGIRRQLGLVRSSDDRQIAGVAGGLGRAHGIDPALIRIAFGVLALAGGSGVLLYLALALLMAPSTGGAPVRPIRTDLRTVAGIACVTLGALVWLRHYGIWFGDALVWPAGLAALGGAVIWAQRSDTGGRSELLSPQRLAVGGLIATAGVVLFLVANVDLYAVPSLILPLAAVVAGVAIVFGPWFIRSWTQLSEERRERIRSEERSAMAAHLHDSVLQTLALIQRADSPSRMSTLARVQERELRAWLYGRTDALVGEHLSTAIDIVAGRVEEMHEVTVEVVTVGDAALDDDLGALVAACGEAMNNAARHSGSVEISVYIEVEPKLVTAFVRDQGKGFDPQALPSDRHGITHSIVGRLERHGGAATISSAPGRGTEVVLKMPRGKE